MYASNGMSKLRIAFAIIALSVMVSAGQGCSTAPEPRLGTVRSAATFAANWVPLGPNLVMNGEGWDPYNTGPAPRWGVTGRISVVVANPLNPTGDVWVGAASGGLWHGTPPFPPPQWQPATYYQLLFSWKPVLDSLSPLSIGAIKLTDCNATRCNNVWVGTGENSIRRDT